MASEVCKAYRRGALVTNWFWNKLLGHPHPWNQRWCLELRANRHIITKVFSIIPAGLRDPESCRQSTRSRENRTETTHLPTTQAGQRRSGQGVPGTAPGSGAGELLPPLPTSPRHRSPRSAPSETEGSFRVRSLGPSLLLSNQWNQTLPVAISILGCQFLSACP